MTDVSMSALDMVVVHPKVPRMTGFFFCYFLETSDQMCFLEISPKKKIGGSKHLRRKQQIAGLARELASA